MKRQFKLHVAAFLSIWITASGLVAAPASYQLNENIEVSTTDAWDKATIIEVGTAGGPHEGEYKVHFAGYAASYDRWSQPIYFRKVAAGAAPAAAPKAAYQLSERIEVNTTGAWDKATVGKDWNRLLERGQDILFGRCGSEAGRK